MSIINPEFSQVYKDQRETLLKEKVEIPQVTLYELGKDTDQTQFIEALKYLPQKEALSPWHDSKPQAIVMEALQRGLFVDRFGEQLDDYAKLRRRKDYFADRTAVLQRYLEENDRLNVGTVAEFPWKLKGRFVHLLDRETFYRVAFSRNRFAYPEETQRLLRQTVFAIDGLGVGTTCAYLLVLSGAENFLVCDGGSQDLHDHNRLIGAKASEIGLNQAIRFSRMALETNPYLRLRCYPQNLEPGTGNVLKLEQFLEGVGIVIEEADSLPTKLAVRQARKKDQTVFMATDLGMAGLVQVENEQTSVFQGRLTPEILQVLTNPQVDFATKTQLAAAVVVGPANIPPSYLESITESQKAQASFWPQPGLPAFLSASLLVAAIIEKLKGNPIQSEIKINLEDIVRQTNFS